jgi:signal transduction histidine kinase
VAANVVPLYDPDGAFAGVIGTFHDITELQAAQTAALEANRAKSEFLSRMSHELCTPLNAILGFAQLMELEGVTAEQAESIEQILDAGRHLLDLINEVQEIARIESGGLSLSIEPVHLGETLLKAIDLVRPLAQRAAIQVQSRLPAACDAYVLADRQRLKQVLLNLLVDAVKYNRPGGSVGFLCVRAAKPAGPRLTVHDTGPGIAPEELHHLFTPFDRLGAEQSGVEGSGLGLAIAQRLMEAMGGRIGVESHMGEGSSLWIELPRAEMTASRLAGD